MKFRMFENAIDEQVGNSGRPQDMLRSRRDDAECLAAQVVPGPQEPAPLPGDDPIFPLIAEHRAAMKAHDAACRAKPYDDAAAYAKFDVWKALLKTKPATIDGVFAFALHAQWYAGKEPSDETVEEALKFIAAAVRRLRFDLAKVVKATT